MNRIFTRIWSRETCTVNQSSFLIDCLAISGMLKNSSPKTFLLIDEFGKGNLPFVASILAHLQIITTCFRDK